MQQDSPRNLLTSEQQLQHTLTTAAAVGGVIPSVTTPTHFKGPSAPDFTLYSPYSSFRADLKPSILVRGTFQLMISSLPTILTAIVSFFQNFISIYYAVSQQDTTITNAFNLGSTFLYVFGYNIIQAFNSNLMALISQAHGSHDPFTIGLNFQRGIIFQFPLYGVFLITEIIFSHGILPHLGITSDEAEIAAATKYIHYSSISVLFSGIFEVGRIYMCGQNYFNEPFYARSIATMLNGLLAFILFPSSGLTGLAIAKVISEFASVLILYAFIAHLHLTEWLSPSGLMSISKFWDYLKFILPGGFSVYMQYFYVEVLSNCVMRAANLPTTTVITFVNLRPLMFAIPLGTQLTVSSFVGQSIGELAKKKAQTASLIAMITSNVYFVIQIIAWYFLEKQFEVLLNIVNSMGVLVEFERMYVLAIVFIESNQFLLTGILKGLGKLHENLKIYFIGFYVIGGVATLILKYIGYLSLHGIWVVYFISYVVVCLCQARFLFKVNWESLLSDSIIGVDNDIELPLIGEHPEKNIAGGDQDKAQ